LITVWKKNKNTFYKFKAKDFEMLLPTMVDVKFEEIIGKDLFLTAMFLDEILLDDLDEELPSKEEE